MKRVPVEVREMAREGKRIDLAREQRKSDIPAEKRLWAALRNRRLAGFKFRRQHPIGRFTVDFACPECNLVVEIDGESHLENRNQDEQRTKEIEQAGWHVIRFWNTDVYDDFEVVVEAIYRACIERTSERLTPR